MCNVIHAYTDASSGDSVGIAVSVIKERHKLLKVITGEYPTIGPSAAELYGILQCLKYLNKCYPDREIVIYTDLETAVRTFEKLQNKEDVSKEAIAYPKLWRQIMRECKKLNVTFVHRDSHQTSYNENMACDRLASYIRKNLEKIHKEALSQGGN